MSDDAERAAKIAERYGRCFGEKPPNGERGTNIVWSTAQSIASLIRSDAADRVKLSENPNV